MSKVIGPNGKDVFSIAISYSDGGYRCLDCTMVEALSKTEAIGIGHTMAKNIKGKNIMIHVNDFLGAYDVSTRKIDDYGKQLKS